jgi:HD-like signal output (HDOD) protein
VNTSNDLEELIDSTVSIPTIPTTLVGINRVFASPDGSAREASEIIEKDPAIATKVLRLVNSSFYSLKNPINAIGLACSILGLKVLKNLVVQASVLQEFSGKNGGGKAAGLDPAWLWDHSFKTAFAARRLAMATRGKAGLDKEDAYTAGLVHDVGKILCLEQQTKTFGEAVRRSDDSGAPLANTETELLGFSHADLAALLVERWNLSTLLQQAVSHHHDTAAAEGAGAAALVVRCANTIAHEVAPSPCPYTPDLADRAALAELGIADAELQAIRDEVRTQAVA